jgi:Flp pilus assembly protein TadG
MVEFAIIATLLFVLVFGFIDFSILLYDQAVITNASREGARAGIVQRWDNTQNPAAYYPLDNGTGYTVTGTSNMGSHEISKIVGNYITNNLINFGSGSPTVIVSYSDLVTLQPQLNNGIGTQDQLVVTVTYPYNFLAGIVVGSDITLRATTTMRIE